MKRIVLICLAILLLGGGIQWIHVVRSKTGRSYDSLLQAIEAGQTEEVKRLLDRGVDPNCSPENRLETATPALTIASAGKDVKIARLLLDHGADVNASDPWLGSPLVAAGTSKNYAIMDALIEHGANKEKALWDLAVDGRYDGVKYLLSHGAKPDRRNLLRYLRKHNGKPYVIDLLLHANERSGHTNTL